MSSSYLPTSSSPLPTSATSYALDAPVRSPANGTSIHFIHIVNHPYALSEINDKTRKALAKICLDVSHRINLGVEIPQNNIRWTIICAHVGWNWALQVLPVHGLETVIPMIWLTQTSTIEAPLYPPLPLAGPAPAWEALRNRLAVTNRPFYVVSAVQKTLQQKLGLMTGNYTWERFDSKCYIAYVKPPTFSGAPGLTFIQDQVGASAQENTRKRKRSAPPASHEDLVEILSMFNPHQVADAAASSTVPSSVPSSHGSFLANVSPSAVKENAENPTDAHTKGKKREVAKHPSNSNVADDEPARNVKRRRVLSRSSSGNIF
ncbi:hypothetical protein EUX98_g5193 [Antrodiella citrinella]|uniref:Uncharacterized protein n=1 Tax=Antrodiella citrinella TaxID=2447956 RepID=A0A4S4N000_9APHY|nr:hypothetical protein EUX98_g5193 [Antrodiella citrinella]